MGLKGGKRVEKVRWNLERTLRSLKLCWPGFSHCFLNQAPRSLWAVSCLASLPSAEKESLSMVELSEVQECKPIICTQGSGGTPQFLEKSKWE